MLRAGCGSASEWMIWLTTCPTAKSDNSRWPWLLVTEPTILMLDEPASGLSQGERENLTQLLLSLPEGLTLILIEHDMDVALKAAEQIVVMSDGRVIVSGNTEEIRHDPVVHEIYLGEAERGHR